MNQELIWNDDIVPVDVMMKTLWPEPNAVSEISASHLPVVNTTAKAAPRQAAPRFVGGTTSQVGHQLLLFSR
jgi:hypothetical protein